MTAPQAPAAEKAAHKPEALPVAEKAETNRVDELASLSGLLPIAGSDLTFLDPSQVTALQKTAGNHAVRSLIQRAPTDAPPKPPPKFRGRPQAPVVDQEPLGASLSLFDNIDKMPALTQNITTVIERKADRLARKGFEDKLPKGSISSALIFTRDAVYFFNATSVLFAVESNLQGEFDPKKPKEIPPERFTLPKEDMVLVSEPSSGRNWQVFATLGKSKGTDDDEDPEITGLNLVKSKSKPNLPSNIKAGELVVSVYLPFMLARNHPGVPQPGWKVDEGRVKPQPKETPKWANLQYKRLKEILKAQAAVVGVKTMDDAQGVGRQGKGEGGGGTGMGIGTGATGTGIGAATETTGQGRGADSKKNRAKPDKVVLWMRGNHPMLNVWKNGSHEAIPLKTGEKAEDLHRRVEEAAGKQQSTGETLANAATQTEIIGQGGEGSGKATAEQIAEATQFTANAAEYPSKMAMQGGSGAEVSPNGWATTITGGKHKFDMVLDYDARAFGLANQVFARLGFIDYFWQVIDIAGMQPGAGTLRPKGETESQADFDLEMRKRARVAAQNQERVREPGKLEALTTDVSREAGNKWADAKEDLWASKAQGMGLVALDAAWNIGKALISAFVSKMTEPENRQEIAFAKPGEYLVRCLANPQPDKDAPPDKQTRRATSIAVFPVRVVDVNKRAREVTQQDQTQLKQAQYLFDQMQKKADAEPKNEGLQAAMRIARHELGLVKAKYEYTAVQKINQEISDYDKQIAVLEKLANPKKGLQPADLPGDEKMIGMQMKDEVLKRWGRSGGIAAWYEYEYQIEDVKKARKKKAEQKAVAEKKSGEVKEDSEIRPRPRVTFVSEENGALVRMDMILGRAKNTDAGKPRWKLADVTTEDTARSYDGASDKSGDEGDAEAIKKAFQAFCDKAEYGRGTIAIEMPGNEKLMPSGTTMLMKPGEGARWRGRLKSLVEIAGLVAPYVKGGQLIGRIIAAYGALEAAEKLYDRAVNDRLKANFETLTDVVAVLAPMAQMGPLAQSLRQTNTGKFILKSVDAANEFMMPATFLHDLDKIVRDTSMGGPEREAAIVMLFGRGLRDGTVQYVKVSGPHRAGGEQLAPVGTETTATGRPSTVEGPPAPVATTGQPVAQPAEGAAPVARPAGESGAPAPAREPPARKPAVHEQFDTSDVTRAEPARRRGRDEASEPPPETTRPDIRLPEAEGGPSGRRPGDGPEPAPGTEKTRKANIEIIQAEARADARARARAAEFAPLFFKWKDLHPVQRQKQLEQLINAHLASEGVPPVIVNPVDVRAGNASFRYQQWRIQISEHTINNNKMTPDRFAELVDNATHEARHAVHHYRGLRIALREGRHDSDAKIHEPVVAAARKANRQRDPRKEMSEEAYGEAKEIYEITHLAKAREAKLAQRGVTDVLNRENVLGRKDVTADALRNAAKKLEKLESEGKKGTREYADALADQRIALHEAQNAHDAYVGLQQETDAGRYGSAVRKATSERLALMMRVNGAKAAREQAAQAARDAKRLGDRADVDAQADAYLAAHKRVLAAQAELDGFVSKEPKLVGGRLAKHELPADPSLGRRTTGAADPGERLRPGEVRLPPREGGRSEESAPPPGGGSAGKPEAGDVGPARRTPPNEPSGEPAVGGAKKETWMGRPADSDLPEGAPVGAAIGRGIPKVTSKDVETPDAIIKGSVGVGNMFTPIKRGAMKPVGKPGAGTSESVVMVDVTSGKKYLFKPIGGEPDVPYAEQRGVVAGHYAERARAGAISADELGVATPAVRLVEINGRKGSLTDWVEPTAGGEVMSLEKFAKSDPEKFKQLQKKPEFVQALSGIQALDYLINNVDRVNNLGNYMIELHPNGEFKSLIPIDQELSFTSTEGRAVVPGKTSNLPTQWTPDLAQRVAALHADPYAFITKIRPLVGDQAISGVISRLSQLHADAVRRGAIVPGGGGGGGGGGGQLSGSAGSPRSGVPLSRGGATAGTGQPAALAPGGDTAGTGQPVPLARGGATAGTGQPTPVARGGASPGAGQPTALAPGGETAGTGGPAPPPSRGGAVAQAPLARALGAEGADRQESRRDPGRPVEPKPAEVGRTMQPDAARARRAADEALGKAEADLRATELEPRDSPKRRAAETQYAAAWRAQATAYGRSLGDASAAGRRAKADERLAQAESRLHSVRDDPPTSLMRGAAEAELLAARKERQQAYGTWKEPPPFRWDHEMVIQLGDAKDFRKHRELFFSLMDEDATREVGLFRNSVTGEVIVVRGNERNITVQPGQGPRGPGNVQRWKDDILAASSDAGNWELIEHSHPSPRRGEPARPIQKVPSGATGDFGILVRDSIEAGWRSKNSRIFYMTAQGRQSTEFGFDPRSREPYWFAVAGGPVVRFASLDAYHNYVRITLNADPGPVPPNMPQGAGLGRYQPPGATVAAAPGAGTEPEGAPGASPRPRAGTETVPRVGTGPAATVPKSLDDDEPAGTDLKPSRKVGPPAARKADAANAGAAPKGDAASQADTAETTPVRSADILQGPSRQGAPPPTAPGPAPTGLQAAETDLDNARAARVAADARLAQARAATQGAAHTADEMLLHAAEAEPAVDVATARLAEARAIRKVREARLAAATGASEPDRARLAREAQEAISDEGYAEVRLGEAQKQAVRAKRVAEGIATSRAKEAARAERMNVQPIDDPDEAARLFIEGQSGTKRGIRMARGGYVQQWRDFHRQELPAPAAGWRRADGTVVINGSNPKVAEAVQRLASARKAGSGGGGGSGPAQPRPSASSGIPSPIDDPNEAVPEPIEPEYSRRPVAPGRTTPEAVPEYIEPERNRPLIAPGSTSTPIPEAVPEPIEPEYSRPPVKPAQAQSAQVAGIPRPDTPAPDYEELEVTEGGRLGKTSTTTTGNRKRTRARRASATPLGALNTTNPSIVGYSSEDTTETVVGKTDEGVDIKKTTSSRTNVNLGLKGMEAGKEISHTTAGGTKVGAGANVSADWSGNVSTVGSLTFASRQGLSVSPTVGHSDQADASDPQYVEGVGFLVTFKISSTDSVGLGAGKSRRGRGASVNVGKSETEYQSGSRILKTYAEAIDFRDNVRKRAQRSAFMPPPTSVMGALQIPMGESRGGGTATATTIGGSASYAGGLGGVGYTHASTSNQEVSVMRVGPTAVDVTRTFSEDTTSDPNISGLGLSNTKGTGEETGRAVTYRFNLATESGVAAFNRWCANPQPPGAGATDRRVKTFKSANAHDDYGFPVKYSASWKGRVWESREVDEAGNVTETFGGGQDRDTRTGWISENITRDKEQHANAQIEATLKNGKESYAARFTVSGKSGDSNLEELGKMFSGARHEAGDSSGYWLVTAQIDPAVVRELERNSKAFRNAKTTADRMRIYSDYAREHGAHMISGQVRSGGDPLAWNLELPGDPNFPGASGRAELEGKHKAQREQLADKHDSAAAVADDAKQTITKLEKRKAEVADRKRYTDLPDQLREQQVKVIDQHLGKFAAVRSQSESLAMRNDPNEDIGKIRARATSPGGYDKLPDDQREIRKLSDAVAMEEQDIATASKRVEAANAILKRMMPNNVRRDPGVKFSVYWSYNLEAKQHRDIARVVEPKLKASAQKARDLRNQWSDAKDDPSRLVALRALDAELKDQLRMVELELQEIREATRSAYIVTSDVAIGKDWDYFKAIKVDDAQRALAINTAAGDVPEDEL